MDSWIRKTERLALRTLARSENVIFFRSVLVVIGLKQRSRAQELALHRATQRSGHTAWNRQPPLST